MKWHGQVTRSHGHAKTIMQEIILVVRDMCKINATSTHTRSFGPFYNDVDGWMDGFVERRSPVLPCNQKHIDILLIGHS